MESAEKLLIDTIGRHPREAAAIFAAFALLAVIGNAWQAFDKAKREAFKAANPRVGALLEVIASLAPLVVRAGRVLRFVGETARDSAPPALPRASDLPDPPKGSSPGCIEIEILRSVAAAAVVVVLLFVALDGCRLPPPDGCTPLATRCSPSGVPETCSQSQRWSHAPPASPCAARGPVVCCGTRSPYGREIHACVPESACLPEASSDAGTGASDER